MKRTAAHAAGWLIGLYVAFLRLTCGIRIHNDPRGRLAAEGYQVAYAAMHANQIAGSIGAQPGTGAMVSRSIDGDLLVPSLRVNGHVPIRGSSGVHKGGATALQALIQHVRSGRAGIIACDGPRGPRGQVQKGIALLARKANAKVVPSLVIPSRRWILSQTWDRLQIPIPFCTIDIYFGEPLGPRPDESVAQFAKRVQYAINSLELRHDPQEADPSLAKPDSETEHDIAAAA